jgi:hypothetical protein
MTTELYKEIPEYPEHYTAGTVLGRIVDGIGFRYRWATQGLTEQELDYRPGKSCRSIHETVTHIHNLVVMATTGLTGQRYSLPEPSETKPFDKLRQATLVDIQKLSEQLKAVPNENFEEMPIRLKLGDDDLDFPFWNAINGPVADALYHVGQVVSYRRAAGNPIDPQVNVFLGKRMDS